MLINVRIAINFVFSKTIKIIKTLSLIGIPIPKLAPSFKYVPYYPEKIRLYPMICRCMGDTYSPNIDTLESVLFLSNAMR